MMAPETGAMLPFALVSGNQLTDHLDAGHLLSFYINGGFAPRLSLHVATFGLR